MHALGRVTAYHVKHADFDLNAIFSISKMMLTGSYFDVFCNAVLEECVNMLNGISLAVHRQEREKQGRGRSAPQPP